MFKKIIYLIMAALIILGLAGDWTRVEPEEMAVGLSFVYDKTDEGYKITGEFLDVSPASNGEVESQSFLLTFEAKSVSEAFKQNLQLEKTVFGTHTRVRFFTENLALYGLEDLYDFFFREFYLDQRPFLMVIKSDDPLLIYQAETGLSQKIGDYIYNLSELKNESSTLTTFVSTLDFAKDLYREGKQPVMGVIEIEENEIEFDEQTPDEEKPKKYIMNLEGLAVFKGDKLIGYIDGQQTRAYNYIVDKVNESFLTVPMEGGDITVRVTNSQSEIKTEYKNGNVIVNVEIKNKLAVSENNTDYDISQNKQAKEVEKQISAYLKEDFENTVSKVQQELASDIFGFGACFHIDNPKIWKVLKDNWDDEYFKNAQVNIKVQSDIELEGYIREKFGEDV